MPTSSLDLPFSVSTKEGSRVLTPSMEVAAVLLLAEAKRPRGALFRNAPTHVSFVSKLHYPLWAVPWDTQFLIIDGLGAYSSTFVKMELPDVSQFIEDVGRGARNRALYRNALENHQKTFSAFAKTMNIRVDSVITDKEVLSDISEYMRDGLSVKSGGEPIVFVPLKVNVEAAAAASGRIQALYRQIQSEIASLKYVRNLLEETLKLHEQMILREINVKRAVYEKQIADLKPSVEKEVDKLLKERDARLARMSRITGTDLKAKEREVERRERELQRLTLAKANFVRKREARHRKHDKIGEAHWEHRIRTTENRIEEVNARNRSLTSLIRKIRSQSEADAGKLKQGYQWLIDQERRKIIDIEIQRDGSAEAKQRESEMLRFAAGQVEDGIEGLAVRKREEAEQLRKFAISSQLADATLLCMPFYLICYKTESAMEFQILSPIKVMSYNGVVGTIRRKLGGLRVTSGIAQFLQPRSKALSQMLDVALKDKMKSDKGFSENVQEAAVSGNILLKDNIKETLARGADELKAEGWINDREETIIKALVQVVSQSDR